MKVVQNEIAKNELVKMAQARFGTLVKAVVDIKKEIMAVDAEMHADEEQLLIEDGSSSMDLWGINIFPELSRDDWIEFDSMINLKPHLNNRSRGVDDPIIREKIIEIVNRLVKA
ncbi:MAG: DUF5674 family protein [Candidatus Margulisiibacteriota bacterium]